MIHGHAQPGWVTELSQVLVLLFTGEKNQRLLRFGSMLGLYAYRMLQFLTFNSDEKPFPFADWDSEDELVTDKN